jgi:hypothetical protein
MLHGMYILSYTYIRNKKNEKLMAHFPAVTEALLCESHYIYWDKDDLKQPDIDRKPRACEAAMMTPKERIVAVLNRQPVNRLPVDLWHTPEVAACGW